MDNTGRLRLIVVGLILAAVAFGFFLFTKIFGPKSPTSISGLTTTSTRISPTPVPAAILTPTPTPVLPKSTGTTGTTATTLPNTGSPVVLEGIFSLSAAAVGFTLRKYSK